MDNWILPAAVAAALITALVNLGVAIYNVRATRQAATSRQRFERLERKRDAMVNFASEFKKWRPPTVRDAPFCHELTKPGITPSHIADDLCKAVETAFDEARRVYDANSHLLSEKTRAEAEDKLFELKKHSERMIEAGQRPNTVVVGAPLGYAECHLDFFNAVASGLDRDIQQLEQELDS
jgi:uncharacterized membrane protein YccC